MPRKLPIRWADYERCPVCFRTYDCRPIRRTGRVLWRLGQTWPARRIVGLTVGWEDRTMTRPHNGRRLRSSVIK